MAYLIPPRSFSRPIEYRPPVNMKREWEHLFTPDLAYQRVKLGARLLNNVFVNHYGLVVNKGFLVKGCAPNIGHFPYADENFYRPHWKKATEQMLVARFGKSIPSMRLDDNRTYLLIHSPWFSYYFWITECLPRLLMVREHLPYLTLIYPESWRKFSFVNETLALFPKLDRVEIPSDIHLWVKNLVMPEVKPWTPMFIPEYVHEVRDLFVTEQETPQKRTYISRRKAARKKFTAEEAVADFLSTLGFEEVFMEELNFAEQIKLMQQTSVLASMTGAGCINAIFMQPETGFHDLTNMDYLTKKQYKFHYRKLCDIVGINYAVTFFEHENDPSAFHYSAQNLYFNKDIFSQDFDKLMKYVQ